MRPFDEWLREAEGHWTWDWPHQLRIYEKLQMMTEGKAKRLMIFMPPRHSKSETVTVRYAAWRLLREPGMRVILGCYNQRLANRFSRKIRSLVERRIGLSPARKAADEWETKAGGGLCAVGVGAGVTGYGAELIVIDDPVKNRAEAESTAYRERTWDWFNDDIYTRLEPGASIVLIQTRWHEDDLAGRLLAEAAEGGEEWEVLSMPAIAEEDTADWRDAGEALCPERYDREAFDRIRKKIGSYAFASLYQQRPVPRDGGSSSGRGSLRSSKKLRKGFAGAGRMTWRSRRKHRPTTRPRSGAVDADGMFTSPMDFAAGSIIPSAALRYGPL